MVVVEPRLMAATCTVSAVSARVHPVPTPPTHDAIATCGDGTTLPVMLALLG